MISEGNLIIWFRSYIYFIFLSSIILYLLYLFLILFANFNSFSIIFLYRWEENFGSFCRKNSLSI